MFFLFSYLPYAPIRRVNKPDLAGRYIWACSHSNFFCDALPIAYEGPVIPKFLGKSTLFKFPLKGFLDFAGGLPLARAEDLKHLDKAVRASQNRLTFQTAIAAIRDGWPVAIYPEGVSIVSPGLILPLKPGVAKLAFAAEEAHDFSLGLRIIPVGLEYGSRIRVGSGLFIRYGKPLLLSDYKNLFESEPDLATKKLMEDLTREMVGAFPHFTDEAKQSLGKKLVTLGLFRNKFDVAQLFLRRGADAEFFSGLEQRLRAFEEATKIHGIPIPAWGHRMVWKQLGPTRRPWRVLYLILGLPIFLLDLPNNRLPEFFLVSTSEFLAADETERMSVRFFLAPVLLSMVYAVQFWFLRKIVFPHTLVDAGGGVFCAYLLGSFTVWYVAVHWRRQCKRLASLYFFRRAGAAGRLETIAYYSRLRKYLGQL